MAAWVRMGSTWETSAVDTPPWKMTKEGNCRSFWGPRGCPVPRRLGHLDFHRGAERLPSHSGGHVDGAGAPMMLSLPLIQDPRDPLPAGAL